jgi:hypothetical protein
MRVSGRKGEGEGGRVMRRRRRRRARAENGARGAPCTRAGKKGVDPLSPFTLARPTGGSVTAQRLASLDHLQKPPFASHPPLSQRSKPRRGSACFISALHEQRMDEQRTEHDPERERDGRASDRTQRERGERCSRRLRRGEGRPTAFLLDRVVGGKLGVGPDIVPLEEVLLDPAGGPAASRGQGVSVRLGERGEGQALPRFYFALNQARTGSC